MRASVAMSTSTDINLLVVDDDLEIREVVGSMLELEGYKVRLAEDGLDALTQLESFEPDLVLLDVRMPVMDAPEFLRRLRARSADGPPVVLMSAYTDLPDTAVELGVMNILHKPFTLSDLFAKVGGLTRAP
jgi:two-component system response regulator AtoC